MKFSLAELARLAEARQTTVSQQTFTIYAEELGVFEAEDIREGLREMARHARDPFGTAYPDLARVLAAVKAAERNRTGGRYIGSFECERPFKLCGRTHVVNSLIYVDAAGDPCEMSDSPNRTLGLCSCRRDWLAARAKWLHERNSETLLNAERTA